jgi:hypothetical protein
MGDDMTGERVGRDRLFADALTRLNAALPDAAPIRFAVLRCNAKTNLLGRSIGTRFGAAQDAIGEDCGAPMDGAEDGRVGEQLEL